MEPVTIRLPDDTHRTLADEAEENDVSMSAVAREYVRKGMEYDDLEAERDHLQRQLAAVNTRQDDVDELVEYVEEQREAERYERKRRQHNVVKRAWWWLAGELSD